MKVSINVLMDSHNTHVNEDVCIDFFVYPNHKYIDIRFPDSDRVLSISIKEFKSIMKMINE